MAKFDDLYPEAKDDYVSPFLNGNLPPVAKYKCDDPECKSDHKCYCGVITDWVNIAAMTRVCSEECNAKVWARIMVDFVARQAVNG